MPLSLRSRNNSGQLLLTRSGFSVANVLYACVSSNPGYMVSSGASFSSFVNPLSECFRRRFKVQSFFTSALPTSPHSASVQSCPSPCRSYELFRSYKVLSGSSFLNCHTAVARSFADVHTFCLDFHKNHTYQPFQTVQTNRMIGIQIVSTSH